MKTWKVILALILMSPLFITAGWGILQFIKLLITSSLGLSVVLTIVITILFIVGCEVLAQEEHDK